MSKRNLASFAVFALGLVLTIGWACSKVRSLQQEVQSREVRISALER